MQVYHVVTDRPMKCGQHIIFDENHHSGVYERVQEKMEKVHDIYENPDKKNSKKFIKLSTEERKSRIFLYIPQINIEKHIENRNIMLPPHSSWFEPKIPPGVISMEINGY